MRRCCLMWPPTWRRQHPEDELVLPIGRTWHMRPKPGYMVIWRIKDVTTFEHWNAEFAKQTILDQHGEVEAMGTIVDAGVYEDIGHEVIRRIRTSRPTLQRRGEGRALLLMKGHNDGRLSR